MARIFRTLLTIVLFSWVSTALADTWLITKVLPTGSVMTSNQLPLVTRCNPMVCEEPIALAFASRGKRPPNGLPDGGIAVADDTASITQAWYANPTKRYRHGILGDAIEAGQLVVKLEDGRQLSLDLPQNQVFEDRTPRLVDLDGFGNSHVVTIVSDQDVGASIAVYGIIDDQLKMLAQTRPIGRANRWLNIAGIEDFNGDGKQQIAAVETPHIGGTLKFWAWKRPGEADRLELQTQIDGFSNHQIGSREQRLSAVGDFDSNGVADLALPSNDRTKLRIVYQSRTGTERIDEVQLPGPIDKAIASYEFEERVIFTVGLADGSVFAIHR